MRVSKGIGRYHCEPVQLRVSQPVYRYHIQNSHLIGYKILLHIIFFKDTFHMHLYYNIRYVDIFQFCFQSGCCLARVLKLKFRLRLQSQSEE